MKKHISGLVAAPHTPMHPDGSLALDMVEDYARFLAANGVVGAFVCGSSGESMSLTVEERLETAEAWAEAVPEGFLVIVHVGHTSLRDSQAMAEHAEQIGADAIGLMPPVFFKPQDIENLAAFCAEVAQAAPKLPFYYYHIPSLTGVYLAMYEFLERAGERIGTLAGMKFMYEDLMDFGRCLRLADGRYDMLFGRDQILLCALALGCRGAVGTTYNYAAPLYQDIMSDFAAGDLEAARESQARAMELIDILDRFGGLSASKSLMKMMGLDCGPCRPPLPTLSPEAEKRLHEALDEAGFTEYCSKGL